MHHHHSSLFNIKTMIINGGFCMLLLHLACNSSLQAVFFRLGYAKRAFPLKQAFARARERCIAEFSGLGTAFPCVSTDFSPCCVCRLIEGSVDCDSYVFWHWWNIDIFVYFSHHFITIPPLCWITAGHLHQVKVLGDFSHSACRCLMFYHLLCFVSNMVYTVELLMVLQRIMQPSIIHSNRQLDT